MNKIIVSLIYIYFLLPRVGVLKYFFKFYQLLFSVTLVYPYMVWVFRYTHTCHNRMSKRGVGQMG